MSSTRFSATNRRTAMKLVDRLLASPRYGERMAYRWLDAARYADTNGYQNDEERDMWRWRDWVIEAFNKNLPYDKFTLWQIAGDLLPNATREQILATGFNRNHRGNGELGIVPDEYDVEYVVDRVETTATVFLGLTMGCARCHDHKYDPLTQKSSTSSSPISTRSPTAAATLSTAIRRRSSRPRLRNRRRSLTPLTPIFTPLVRRSKRRGRRWNEA
ncbi:MAG: DUF1549 domain-containing protein [Bryobacterales bacterium]